jgi:NAD-dependent deacetylase
MTSRDRERLGDLIEAADQMVAFTGAGISTECGVPDFRSADSAWKRHAPIPFPDFLASEEMRLEAWRRKFAMDDLYAGAQPGRGHAALARLVAAQKLTHVITQNIDGLHQASGIMPERIIELHGNGTYARCLDCGQRHELLAIRVLVEGESRAPSCTACGGIVKSATISFGQAMPQVEMQRARRATLACDLCLVIGSSLVVHPAAAFPALAKENGAVLVILNKDPTPLDGLADLIVRADIGDVMEMILRKGVDDGASLPQAEEKTPLSP